MKNYELAYLISPDLSAKEAGDLSEKIASFVLELGGTVLNNTNPEKRKLGYSIKRKQEAFLGSLEFSILPEKINDFKKKIFSEKQILRHIIIVKAKERKMPEKIRRSAERQKILTDEKEKKVEIEKINEKIDEILK